MSGDDRRYWLSLTAVAAVTLLVAGLAGGTVAVLTSSSGSSMWGAIVVVLVMLVGWTVGYHLRERKKLGLPLWRTLSDDDAATLARYRGWGRSGKIVTPSQEEVADAARGPVGGPRPSRPGAGQLSRRNRLRAEQVRRARQTRAQAEDNDADAAPSRDDAGEAAGR